MSRHLLFKSTLHPVTLFLVTLQGRGGEDWGIDLAQALEAALVGSQATGEARPGDYHGIWYSTARVIPTTARKTWNAACGGGVVM
jgi:hypothetical protein